MNSTKHNETTKHQVIFRKHIPPYPLSIYIQHIIYAQGPSPLPYLMELPEGKVNLIIELVEQSVNTVYTEKNLSGKRTMKNAWLTGTQAQTIIYENNPNSAVLSVRFTTGGFYALAKIPAELIYPGLEAELIFGIAFKEFYQKLINEKNIETLFQIAEEHFLSFIKDDTSEISLAAFVDKNIYQPIDWLVNKSGYSQKHLIHTIKKQTGFSPKYLQRLHRFQNVIKSIQACRGKINWASIAYENNYFDQAHFIKDFVHLMGLTPAEYFALTNVSEHNNTFSDVKLLPGIGR